jgi:hypothetical protein
LAWDGSHERRHTERQSREVVERQVRELDTSVQSLKRDVDALLHRPSCEPWQPAGDDQKAVDGQKPPR